METPGLPRRLYFHFMIVDFQMQKEFLIFVEEYIAVGGHQRRCKDTRLFSGVQSLLLPAWTYIWYL